MKTVKREFINFSLVILNKYKVFFFSFLVLKFLVSMLIFQFVLSNIKKSLKLHFLKIWAFYYKKTNF